MLGLSNKSTTPDNCRTPRSSHPGVTKMTPKDARRSLVMPG